MGNSIKETNEWDWVEGLINPWELGYTAIEFDVQPSKEDIEALINFALLMPNIDKSNKSIWLRSMDILIKKILNRYNSGSSGVYLLLKDGDNLLWGSRPAYIYVYNDIKYSHLINTKLNESQDDLDWIRNIQPSVIRTVEDIRNNLRKPFILVNRKTGEPHKDYEGQPKQYWLDIEGGYNRFNVCFYTAGEERCVSYQTREILANFSEEDDGVFRWVFADSYITESDELDWIRDIKPSMKGFSYDVDNSHIKAFLRKVEESDPDVRWASGNKPSEWKPIRAVRGSTVIRIDDDGHMSYWVDWEKNYKGPNLELIKWPTQTAITESDDLDWIRDIEYPNTITFFIPGQEYYMEKLSNPNSLKTLTFSEHMEDRVAHTYDDGRGALKFGNFYFTPLYIETRLKELGLTLYDLEAKNTITESDFLDDFLPDYNWYDNIDVAIERGTIYTSKNPETLKQILELLEIKFPKLVWQTGTKPTQFFPHEYMYRGGQLWLVVPKQYRLYFSNNLQSLEQEYKYYKIVEV